MKICYLCADPGIPIYGRKGCSTHVRETCHVLRQLGHEVRIVCSNAEGDAVERERLDVISIEPFRNRKLGFDLRHILLDRRLLGRLDALVREWKPDAVYERYSLYSRAGGVAARRHRLPRLLEVNAFLTREQRDRIRWGWLARRIEAGIIRHAPRVIVVSEPLRREIHHLGVPMEAITKMPMAVNLDLFSPERDGEGVRRRHGLTGRFVLGYVGTLGGWHGIRLLYDMARLLKDGGAPPFAFLIVGGDPAKVEMHHRKARESGLEDVLRFIGSVPYQDVPEHIRAMDAALVPDTTYWSSPAKLFEYQASGIPVLAPSYPAIREVLTHEREGFIFPPGDVERMAALALEMMNAPERCRLMGRAARERAECEHSWQRNGQEILALFNREMAAPAEPRPDRAGAA
ncbi:MAG: glycosyltransferase family 4 protein [bacterium]|nr:glycosyltransferase family 4 protein [bacterium]